MATIKNDVFSLWYTSGKYSKVTDQNDLTLEDMGALLYFFEYGLKDIDVDDFRERFKLSRMKMQRIMKNLERTGFAKLVRLKGQRNFAGTQWQLIFK